MPPDQSEWNDNRHGDWLSVKEITEPVVDYNDAAAFGQGFSDEEPVDLSAQHLDIQSQKDITSHLNVAKVPKRLRDEAVDHNCTYKKTRPSLFGGSPCDIPSEGSTNEHINSADLVKTRRPLPFIQSDDEEDLLPSSFGGPVPGTSGQPGPVRSNNTRSTMIGTRRPLPFEQSDDDGDDEDDLGHEVQLATPRPKEDLRKRMSSLGLSAEGDDLGQANGSDVYVHPAYLLSDDECERDMAAPVKDPEVSFAS